jgi:hypothetical protein
MGLFKVKKNVNKKFSQNNRRNVKYVWLASEKAIFLITGDIKESKYSYGVPIIPLSGLYYSSKDKRTYTAKKLSNYYVVLNIDKDDANALRGKKVVVLGYNESEMLFVPADGGGDKNGSPKA